MPAYNDGTTIQHLSTEDVRVQKVRELVLEALDNAALELYGTDRIGWTDSELPSLFQAIDRQAASILERVCEGK